MADPISDLVIAVEIIFDIAEFGFELYEAGISLGDLALEGGVIFEEIVDACVTLYNDFSWEKFLTGDLHIIDRITSIYEKIKSAFSDPVEFLKKAKKKVDKYKKRRVESPEFTDLLTGGILHKKRNRDNFGQRLNEVNMPNTMAREKVSDAREKLFAPQEQINEKQSIPLVALEKANNIPTPIANLSMARQPRGMFLNPDIYPENPIEISKETNLNIPARYDQPNAAFGMSTFLHRTRQ